MVPYVYIVVRKDIRPEYLAPQLCHAALEAGYEFTKEIKAQTETVHLVLLEVDNKIELEMVSLGLKEEKIDFVEFYEGFGRMGLTSLATKPIEKNSVITLQNLRLYNHPLIG